MKKVELYIGDYEYQTIIDIFKEDANFKPMNEKDEIIIQALRAIVSPNNLREEDVDGKETYQTTVKKIKEPKNKDINEGKVKFKL